MSNGSRHALGVVAGLLLPPLIAAGLWYGVGEVLLKVRTSFSFEISWLPVGVLVLSGILLAFVAGSRLSPIASLLGGLSFTALGVLPWVTLRGVPMLPTGWLPGILRTGFETVSYSGVLLFLGIALLAVSVFPSRWRARTELPVHSTAYDPAPSPYLPPQQGPEDATRPMFRD
jgi:hypothetical protein